jgi:hypothetical protein
VKRLFVGTLVALLIAVAVPTVPLLGQARIYQSSSQWKISLTVVEAVTTTRLTAAADDGIVLTNTGDTDGATITLMNDPVAGLMHTVIVTAAQTLTIVPSSGETLYWNGDQCVASITSATIGSTIHIRAATGGSGAIWVATGGGTVACND